MQTDVLIAEVKTAVRRSNLLSLVGIAGFIVLMAGGTWLGLSVAGNVDAARNAADAAKGDADKTREEISDLRAEIKELSKVKHRIEVHRLGNAMRLLTSDERMGPAGGYRPTEPDKPHLIDPSTHGTRLPAGCRIMNAWYTVVDDLDALSAFKRIRVSQSSDGQRICLDFQQAKTTGRIDVDVYVVFSIPIAGPGN
jgi:hypothetical protein